SLANPAAPQAGFPLRSNKPVGNALAVHFQRGHGDLFSVPPPKRRPSLLPPPKRTPFGGQAQGMPVAVGTLFVGLLHNMQNYGVLRRCSIRPGLMAEGRNMSLPVPSLSRRSNGRSTTSG
ncbi:MAG: hypothetical protein JW896_01215, partial [Deltaproteobacteria bacterium]|nr:hypothetical protein [Deltaproteobacteria bacterium]